MLECLNIRLGHKVKTIEQFAQLSLPYASYLIKWLTNSRPGCGKGLFLSSLPILLRHIRKLVPAILILIYELFNLKPKLCHASMKYLDIIKNRTL